MKPTSQHSDRLSLTQLFLSILALTFLSLGAWPACARVELYMGFLDEEVAGVLGPLVAQNPNRQVICLGSDEGVDELFGRTAQFFARSKVDKNAQPAFAVKSFEFPTTARNPSVKARAVVFHPNAPFADPIFVVRNMRGKFAPESRAQMQELLQDLKSLPEAQPARGGLHLSMFGTSGGVSTSSRPGMVESISASLTIAVEAEGLPRDEKLAVATGNKDGDFDEVSTAQTYKGVIELREGMNPKPVVFFTAQAKSEQEALTGAARAFARNADHLVSLDGPVPGTSLRSAISEIKSRTGGNVSLTTPFFAGQGIKTAAGQLGIDTVDMEDFIVFEQFAGKVDSLQVSRVITDPASISQEFTSRLEDWARTKTYTSETYVDAILWGFNQLSLESIPPSAQWDIFSYQSKKQIEKLDYVLSKGETSIVIDPFFIDLADNFFSEVEGVIQSQELLPEQLTESLGDKLSKELNKLLAIKIKEILVKRNNVLTAVARRGNTESLRDTVRDFVTSLRFVDLPQEGQLTEKIAKFYADSGSAQDREMVNAFRLPLLAKGPNEMKVWIRGPLWNIDASILSDVANVSALTDKFLYRSDLWVITQSESGAHVAAELKRIAASASKVSAAALEEDH